LYTILQKTNSTTIRGDKELAQCLEKRLKPFKQLALIAVTSKEYIVLLRQKNVKSLTKNYLMLSL
jgi:hypothetical protein